MITPPLGPVFDCVVLSGGGAKGAYGAGVAKAIDVARRAKKIDTEVCYIGTSAGALNAYILASRGPDVLLEFWREASMRSVLGTQEAPSRLRLARRYAAWSLRPDRPFSLYDNAALKKLIRDTARLADLRSPLIVAATDYTRAALRAFYRSPLIERLVSEDSKLSVRGRRLGHLRLIDSDDMLANALLASSAIPVFFPPVRITTRTLGDETEDSWFVDGGVGNNTPTREAAYFFRYLEDLGLGQRGTVYCVTQDPPRVYQDGRDPVGVLEISARTLEVFNYIHTKPIVDAWGRINAEVEQQQRKVKETIDWLHGLDLAADARDAIGARIRETFEKVGGRTPRLSAPLIEIQPTSPLGETFDFSRERAENDINRGYTDALGVLRRTSDRANPGSPLLDEAEHSALVNRPI